MDEVSLLVKSSYFIQSPPPPTTPTPVSKDNSSAMTPAMNMNSNFSRSMQSS